MQFDTKHQGLLIAAALIVNAFCTTTRGCTEAPSIVP